MCGIIGTVNISLSEETVNILNHRGPDDIGTECLLVRNHKVSLGHRRLSIVDLSPSGHQPMYSSSGNHVMVYNGEIYNHLDIRKSIGSYLYNGTSDTETILASLQSAGTDSIKKLNGIFAFAYVNKVSAKLYLVRDPFGVKPLYYWTQDEKFIFGSELKPIIKLAGKVSMDEESLSRLLRLRFVPSPYTLISGVKKVRPGHIIEVDLASPSLVLREYAYTDPLPQPVAISFKEALDLYNQKFTEAVKSQLMADVEVGVLLSGGVDSAMVAAIAGENVSYKMKAFTIGFDSKHHTNEIESAAQTAKILGLDHFYEKIGFDDFLSVIKKTTSIVEEPLATDSMVPMFFLSKLAAQHVKVVLTGQGADEPLGGYRRYQGELILKMLPGGLKRIIPLIKKFTKNEAVLRGLNAYGSNEDFRRFVEIYSLFTSDEVRDLMKQRPDEDVIEFLKDISTGLELKGTESSVAKMMAIDLRLNLPDDLLLYTDKISMHHSLEARVPMLDHSLITFLESLPVDYKVKIGQTKIIHKKLASSFLPNQIVNRKKLGFQSPTAMWFKEKEGQIRSILLTPGSKLSGYLDVRMIDAIIKQHMAGYDRSKQIFLMLNLYFWCDEFM